MRTKQPDLNNIEEIDQEIAGLDKQLEDYKNLLQRRADLQHLRSIVVRLWGKPPVSSQAPTPTPTPGIQAERGYTASDLAFTILQSSGPLVLQDLMLRMRSAGWNGSDDDEKDRKRVYAAIYNKPEFERDEQRRWKVKAATASSR